MVPLRIIPSIEFDDTKHIIDVVAQKYLKQASKSVQHLVPVQILADGNCLFSSIASIMPDSHISAVELRGSLHSLYIYIYKKCVYDKFHFLVLVRTIIELVKNKTHYINQCSKHVGLFDEALRRTCSNSRSSELYELVALASVLQCEIQSVYPYIDYRAEMKIMNAVYKPAEISVSSNGRVIIFWSSTEDEVSTRARPGNNGIWNPNHCVPLLQQHRNSQTTTKMRASTIRDVKHERV